MVGVPGRSKACNTCRQRKVSCSLEKPECRTCIKASRICAGYQRKRVFVHGQGTAYQGSKDVKMKSCVNTDRELSIRQKKPGSSIQDITRDSSENTSTASTPPSSPTRIPSISPNSAYRKQILNEFISYAMPATYGGGPRERSNGNWLISIPALPHITTALEAAILAVSTAKLGRLNDNPALVHESLKFYVQSLWELQKALRDSTLMQKEETLAACMAMILYEVVECPDKTLQAWANHMRGCAKLFEVRGANAYGSDFGHQLFLSFRIIEIQQAFVERRQTFLAQSEWINLPFQDRPKTMFQRLLDLVVIVPNIIADGYQMLQGPVEGTKVVGPEFMLLTILGLVDRCWKVDSQLQQFYKNLEEDTLGPVYWPELSAEIEGIDTEIHLGKVFPVSFQFLDMRTAHICLVYWACMAILWSGMGYTYGLLASIAAANAMNAAANGIRKTDAEIFDITQLPPLSHRTDVATLARNICQSIEFCLGDQHRGLGARAAVFPLKVAIETLHDSPGCERELSWAQVAMARINQTGVRIMKHLPDPITNHAFLPG